MKLPARALGPRLLGRPPIVRRAAGRPDAVALTFDDGPSIWTPAIAESLEFHGCRGTFFLLGEAVRERPKTVAALAGAGHELGSHLWSHCDAASQSRATLRRELERTAEAIRAAAGTAPALIRPPYCSAPRRVARAARGGRAALIVLRSVDPADWNLGSGDEIVDRVLAATGPGDIVCMHDGVAPGNRGTPTRAHTVAAVAAIVPALLGRGLRPVTVSELLA